MSKNDIKGSFQFWGNYYRAVKGASNPAAFSLAIAEFFFEGIEPDFDNEHDQLLWDLIRSSIACSRRQSNRGQGAPAGSRNNPSGRRGKTNPKTNPQTNPRTNPRTKQIEVEIEKEDSLFADAEGEALAPPTTSQKFVKPTLEEVRAYCESRGNNVDAGRGCEARSVFPLPASFPMFSQSPCKHIRRHRRG